MHQTEFKRHRARIIKAFTVESSKFALFQSNCCNLHVLSAPSAFCLGEIPESTSVISVRVEKDSVSLWQYDPGKLQQQSLCCVQAVLGNFSRVKLFFLMSFIPSPKMSLCLCSLFLSWRLNLPLQRQRLFCVVTRRRESLKSNPGCRMFSWPASAPRFPELFLFPFRLLCQTFVLGSRWIESATRSFLTNTRGD